MPSLTRLGLQIDYPVVLYEDQWLTLHGLGLSIALCSGDIDLVGKTLNQKDIKSTLNHELFCKYRDVCMQVEDEGK